MWMKYKLIGIALVAVPIFLVIIRFLTAPRITVQEVSGGHERNTIPYEELEKYTKKLHRELVWQGLNNPFRTYVHELAYMTDTDVITVYNIWERKYKAKRGRNLTHQIERLIVKNHTINNAIERLKKII